MFIGLDELPLASTVYLSKTYDPLLIGVSIVIAIVSAFTAFGTAERALNSETEKYKRYWILFGAVSLGLGIWAMHFIGMLAIRLPVPVGYSVGITVASILPGIAASGVILRSMVNGLTSFKQAILGGTLFAGGVTAMHLIGMSAMQMSAMMHYEWPILLLSVLSAIIFATIGLQLQVRAFTIEKSHIFNKHQLASAVVMGMAISSMHYMAIYATHYSATERTVEVTGISSPALATIISISVLFVILLSFLIPTILAAQYRSVAGSLRQKFESELARNLAITDLAYDAWIHLNSDGQVLGWNKSAEAIFGWTKQEVLGKKLSKFIIPHHYKAAHDKGFSRFLETGEGSVLNKILELEAKDKSGRHFLVEITITTISVEQGYEFSAFLRDISERKQEENKNAQLMRELQFEQGALDAHAIVSVLDVNAKIIYTNEKFERISQYSRNELLGEHCRLLEYEQNNTLVFENLWATISSGEVWHGVIKSKAKDGSPYWLSLTIVPFLDEQGHPVRYVSIGTDITSQKLLEEKYEFAMIDILREKKVAEQANRAKSDFLASMSHEFRTPLNAILGFAQLIQTDRQEPLSEKHQEDIKYIVDSGKHLLSLINNILDLAKIEAGKSVVSLESIRLDDVIRDAVTLVHNLAEDKQVVIEIIAKDSSLIAIADYTKLKQVLTNLISNAVKYNREGGKVSIDYYLHNVDRIHIVVADNGFGIAKEDHHRIFSAFDRLGQETSSIEGTGVGLVVTKNLVELMGGSIGFDKERTQGASFWVELPPAMGEQADDTTVEKFHVEDLKAALTGEKQVLCVEDNPVNQELMVSFLATTYPDVNVQHAVSAEQAWRLLEQNSYDLILMDINLPEMDGISLASKIRDLPAPKSTIPIIAVSALVSSTNADELGGVFDAYITKPVDFNLLRKLLEEYLNN